VRSEERGVGRKEKRKMKNERAEIKMKAENE
jgi:hypothetical protein